MDILHLIDRLEALITESQHIPFTSNIVVQEDAILDIIDQMRVSIPEEVKLARRTEAERERLLLQAKEEGDRLVEMAREKAAQMTQDHELIRFAEERAREIEEEAYQQAEEIVADADEYTIDQLSNLEEHLMKTLTIVRNGLHQVRQTQTERYHDEPTPAQDSREPVEQPESPPVD